MMHEDHYAYEQRAERLRDYAPQISHASALMQARFEAHGIGAGHPRPTQEAEQPDTPTAEEPNPSQT